MPNVMAAQPYIGGALCESSVIPFIAPRRKVWLKPAAGVPCSNAINIGERKTWTQSEVCTWQNSVRGQKPPKVYIQSSSPGYDQTLWKVWLASGKRRRCSNEAKTRNPLKFAGVHQTNRSQPSLGWSLPDSGYLEEILRFKILFRLSMLALAAKIQPDKFLRGCAEFASRIFSKPCTAHFRPAFLIRTKATSSVGVW